MTLGWWRRLASCFRRYTLADMLYQDLDDTWMGLREATKNREHWEAVERMLRARQARINKELARCQQGV